MHANFSNTQLRTANSKAVFESVCDKFAPKERIEACIAVYGHDNEQRLSVSDRGASIRIPIYTVQHDWSGYLEDRRPNSAADPYKVASVIIETVNS